LRLAAAERPVLAHDFYEPDLAHNLKAVIGWLFQRAATSDVNLVLSRSPHRSGAD
jgi:hypothetical protein